MRRLAGAGTLAMLMALVLVAESPFPRHAADEADPRVHGVGDKVEGKTYAEWSAVWWQWVSRIKKDRNPVLDKTGEFTAEGQEWGVWLLAGNVGGKSARMCVIPAGKPVFFPIINTMENATPEKADEAKLRAVAKAQMDRAAELEVTLDGKPVAGLERFRASSPLFTLEGPDKVAEAAFADIVGKQKAVVDGYWVMLKPLPEGKHTLRFKGKFKEEKGKEPFGLDVSYELTVERKK